MIEIHCVLPSRTCEHCHRKSFSSQTEGRAAEGILDVNDEAQRGRETVNVKEAHTTAPQWPIKHIRHLSAEGIQMSNARLCLWLSNIVSLFM